jgi:hypothetical protein
MGQSQSNEGVKFKQLSRIDINGGTRISPMPLALPISREPLHAES